MPGFTGCCGSDSDSGGSGGGGDGDGRGNGDGNDGDSGNSYASSSKLLPLQPLLSNAFATSAEMMNQVRLMLGVAGIALLLLGRHFRYLPPLLVPSLSSLFASALSSSLSSLSFQTTCSSSFNMTLTYTSCSSWRSRGLCINHRRSP